MEKTRWCDNSIEDTSKLSVEMPFHLSSEAWKGAGDGGAQSRVRTIAKAQEAWPFEEAKGQWMNERGVEADWGGFGKQESDYGGRRGFCFKGGGESLLRFRKDSVLLDFEQDVSSCSRETRL